MLELNDTTRKLMQARNEAFVQYYKAKLDLAEANARLLAEGMQDGKLDAALIDVAYR